MKTINLTEEQVNRVAKKTFEGLRRFQEVKDTDRTFVPPAQLPDSSAIGDPTETDEEYEKRFREWVEERRRVGDFPPSF